MKKMFKTESSLESLIEMREVVGSTLGPQGEFVLIHDGRQTISTKDGVTVAEHFAPSKKEDVYATDLVKQAATNTVTIAGDGTTTTTILTVNMYEKFSELQSYPKIDIVRALKKIEGKIVQKIASEVVSISDAEEDIRKIASLSANNDERIGNILSDVFNKISPDGSISVQLSSGSDVRYEITEGYLFDSGVINKDFINVKEKGVFRTRNPMIFVSKVPLTLTDELLPVLKFMKERPIYIIAPDITGEARGALLMNVARHGPQLGFAMAPGYGEERDGILEDIAIMTGAKVFREGDNFSNVQYEDFGCASLIESDFRKTVISDPAGEDDIISHRMDLLSKELSQAGTLKKTAVLQKRLTRMSCGIAKILIGASTRAEANETKDRIEDAIQAVRNTIQSGYVHGGVSTLMRSVWAMEEERVSDNESLNILVKDIFTQCVEDLLDRLCASSGFPKHLALQAIREGKVVDFKKCEVVEKGTVIEPFNVVRATITSSISASTRLLQSRYSLSQEV